MRSLLHERQDAGAPGLFLFLNAWIFGFRKLYQVLTVTLSGAPELRFGHAAGNGRYRPKGYLRTERGFLYSVTHNVAPPTLRTRLYPLLTNILS